MGEINRLNTFPHIMRKCFKMGFFKSEYNLIQNKIRGKVRVKATYSKRFQNYLV